MMLRSSSTPVLSSLLASASSLGFSDTPSHLPPSSAACCGHFSPIFNHSDHVSPFLGLRRTRSDGSLRSLHHDPSDEPRLQPTPLRSSSSRRSAPVLEAIPSFSICSDEEEEAQEYHYHDLGGSVEINCAGEDVKGGWGEGDSGSGTQLAPLFLARGLGIDRVGSGLLNAGGGEDFYCGLGGGDRGAGGGGKWSVLSGGNGGDQFAGLEAHYKKMVDENPSDALFLRNYAMFLYQTKGDYKRAEEYYSRAILADPSDGEILSEYAKLVWQLHKDQERAAGYFQQAVRAAPNDSNVLAAYAGFMWDMEDDEDTEDMMMEPLQSVSLASAIV